MYRQRFGLNHHPFPQDAKGRSFTPPPSFHKLKKRFQRTLDDPAVGVAIGNAGDSKTTCFRQVTFALPHPNYQVIYLCDTATSPLDFYRQLAREFGLRPSHRRAQLWHDIKTAVTQLVDEQGTQPVIIVDEAQHLSDRFLLDLSGFLNFAFDSRNLLVFWLVGHPALAHRLSMKMHAALDSRVVARVRLEPITDRADFAAFIDAGLKAAGASSSLFSEPAVELLFRASKGNPRRISMLVREALWAAHEREQNFVDDSIIEAVLEEEGF